MSENLFTESPVVTMRDTATELGKLDRVDLALDHGRKGLIVAKPAGREIVDLTNMISAHSEAYRFQPPRRTGFASFVTLASLIEWINRHKGPETVVFANDDPEGPSLKAIINYHEAGAPQIDIWSGQCEPTARHCDHGATFAFPLSREWKAWNKVSGFWLEKDDLAHFIDDRAQDVLAPSPALTQRKVGDASEAWEKALVEAAIRLDGKFGDHARLYAISRSFTVNETSNITVKTNQDTGEGVVNFESEHRDEKGKPIALPSLYVIAIPIFKDGPLYRVLVRFQYRKSGPNLKFRLMLHDGERAFDDAVREALNEVATKTEAPVFVGSPEA